MSASVSRRNLLDTLSCLRRFFFDSIDLHHSNLAHAEFATSKMAQVEKMNDASSGDAEKANELSPEPTIDQGEVKGLRKMHADLNDGDVALMAFAGHEGETIVMTAEQEKALLRKIDLNLMPVWYQLAGFLFARRSPNCIDVVCRLRSQLP